MKTHLTFAEAIAAALRGQTIDDIKMDVSNRGVIHELILVIGATQVYFLPAEGKLAVEFTYERRERS